MTRAGSVLQNLEVHQRQDPGEEMLLTKARRITGYVNTVGDNILG
jgi:hypothetical protein